MTPAVWKGLLRFGLLTIPIKLYRAAQAEKIRFRQVHKQTGARVRHSRCTDSDRLEALPAAKDPVGQAVTAKGKPTSVVTPLSMPATASVQPSMVSRNDLAKGYEFEKGKYVCVSQNALAQLLPPTAGEIDIREFVSAAEFEPVFMDSTYLVVPDRVGQRAYALLLEALCRSGLAGLAQVAMHSRESVVVLRPCGNSIIAQTLFYEAEIRRERQYRADRSLVAAQEITLAVELMEEKTGRFEPLKYFDSYRAAVQALVRGRIEGEETASVHGCEADAGGGSLLDALEHSLKPRAGKGPSSGKRTSARAPDRKQRKLAAS